MLHEAGLLEANKGLVSALAFSPDGLKLAAGDVSIIIIIIYLYIFVKSASFPTDPAKRLCTAYTVYPPVRVCG